MNKILLAIGALVVLTGCGGKQETGFQETSVEQVVNSVSLQESFTIMLTSDNCYSCDVFKEEAEEVLEENKVVIYELNDSRLEESQRDQLHIALGEHSTWPALFYVEDGEIPATHRYEYSLDPEGWKTWMQNMNLIK